MDKWKMAWEIYGALKLAGADIGNASVPIIGKVLGEYITDDGNLTKWPVRSPGVLAGEAREAAPLLLKACEMALEDLEQYEDTDIPGGYAVMETVQTLRAAIAAAKGGEE